MARMLNYVPDSRPMSWGSLSTLFCLLGLLAFSASADSDGPVGDPQLQSAAEIEAVGTAILSWLTDQVGRSPTSGISNCPSLTYDVSIAPILSRADLAALLVPAYIPSIPDLDAWGNPYEFRLDPLNLFDFAVSIRSRGADGLFEGTVYVGGTLSDPNQDLVWANGAFVRSPPLPPGAEQARAFSEIRLLGSAMIGWLVDQIARQPEEPLFLGGANFDLGDYVAITRADLETLLSPTYIGCVPERDPWGHLYGFWLDTVNLLAQQLIAIRSTGADGLASGNLYISGAFPIADQDQDLVWADGFFVRFPDPDWIFEAGFESGDFSRWSLNSP